jgi:hypothetical protein
MLEKLWNKWKKTGNSSGLSDYINGLDVTGEVDVKAYKNGELIYRDIGNNVVTDYMRECIMVLLTGSGFSKNGNNSIVPVGSSASANGDVSRASNRTVTMPNMTATYHRTMTDTNDGRNLDGYILNKGQYFWDINSVIPKYTSSKFPENIYAWFPTKVLLGTGKEYESWAVLKSENETENSAWYQNMLNIYGGSESNLTAAQIGFDQNIYGGVIGPCNTYSGSLASNVFTGNAPMIQCRSVNDPNPSHILETNSDMHRDYGVVGAIKTGYFSSNDSAMLEESTSDEGRRVKPVFRGVGRPAFIYFNAPTDGSEGWSNQTGGVEVTLSKDINKTYLHRITFSVTLPEQAASTNSVGAYYPYNGNNLKQIGLFCDALLTSETSATSSLDTFGYKNMAGGILQAKKNIASLTKTSDISLNLLWSILI